MSCHLPAPAHRGGALLVAALAAGVGCGTDDGINPNPTPTSIAVVSGNNQTGTVGTALAQPLVVVVRDAADAPLQGATVLWTVVSGGGALGSGSSTTNASGQAQAAYTLGPAAGANQVRAAVQGSTLEATFSATGQASPANTPAALVLVSGNNQSATAGTALADSLVVEVRNTEGTPLEGVAVTWTVSGGGAVGAATVTTNSAGRAANTYTAGATAGSPTVTAAVQGNAAIAFTFDVTVTPDATPASIAVVSGNNQSATVSTALAQPLVAVVRNALNQPLQGVTVDWTVTAGGGILGEATNATNASGQVSNTYTVGGSAGTNTIEAAVQSNTSINVAFTATATVASGTSVNVQDNSFNPVDATVTSGSTVTWNWVGANAHNVTWVSGGFANSSTQSSGSHQVTFGGTGSFTYYCTIHGTPTSGMRGSVTVQ